MGGGGVIIILKKNVSTALNLGLNASGIIKVKHALIVSHGIVALIAGLLF
jgi:hypothetical protein